MQMLRHYIAHRNPVAARPLPEDMTGILLVSHLADKLARFRETLHASAELRRARKEAAVDAAALVVAEGRARAILQGSGRLDSAASEVRRALRPT